MVVTLVGVKTEDVIGGVFVEDDEVFVQSGEKYKRKPKLLLLSSDTNCTVTKEVEGTNEMLGNEDPHTLKYKIGKCM